MAGAAAGLSGVLRVTGDPGGTIRFAGGLVAGLETPGAPSPEVLLLRSHRVTESAWDGAFAAAAAAGRPMTAELVARDLIGAGELEALLRTALADAMFVLMAGTAAEVRTEPGAVEGMLPLAPGAEADWLAAEASRRIRVLAALPGPAWLDRDRIIAAPGAVRSGARLGEGLDEILALADGRRTPRDMAFALGRGVYATMLQLARLHETGLLTTAAHRAMPAAGGRESGQLAAAGPEPAPALPRRRRDLPALPSRSWPRGRAPELRAPLGLLRPRYDLDASPDAITQPLNWQI